MQVMSGSKTIVDLFAGCGGMSLGFEMAGFQVLWANEFDANAARTYTTNHHGTCVFSDDARTISDWTSLGFDETPTGVVGGPPCQAYSLCGTRDPKDPRASLFMEFVRCVQQLKPRFFVMENVPGILSMKNNDGKNVAQIIISTLRDIGYDVFPEKINAVNCGVPQNRERVFFLGFSEDLGVTQEDIPIPFASEVVSTAMAISDLPQISAGEGSDRQCYETEPQNSFQKWARIGSDVVRNHIAMKHSKRLIDRFKTILPGQSVADVSDEHSAVQRGNSKVKSGKVYAQNNMRVRGELPCPTVTASFQSNFVHPWLNRNFTAREAARLQSFQDEYVFTGPRTKMSWEKGLSQYQQIGNAVPPLMAKTVAEMVITAIETALKRKDS